MENDIIDSLNDLGYEGPLADEVAFAKAIDGGPKSLEYTKLVHILAEEIKKLCNLEETVNIMNDPDESSTFLLELSSFLKELGCPYKKLVTGHMSSRLESREDKILLLDYLVSELMSARMVSVDCPKEKQGTGMNIVVQESPTAKDLKDILISLKFNKPPPNITPEVLFLKLEAKLKETLQKEGAVLVGKSLYNKALNEKDWKSLESTFTELFEEYRLRRETLITRLECTIQSFEWSDRLKSKRDVIQSTYRPKREQMKLKPNVKLSDFLAARTSLLQIEKTSSASVRKNTQSDVNKVLIGRVPDRGGRPNEQQPPPPEMPSWQQRSAPQGGRGGGRGGDGMGRGVEREEDGAEREEDVVGEESRVDTTKEMETSGLKLALVLTKTAITKPTKCHLAVTARITRIFTIKATIVWAAITKEVATNPNKTQAINRATNATSMTREEVAVVTEVAVDTPRLTLPLSADIWHP